MHIHACKLATLVGPTKELASKAAIVESQALKTF